MALNCDLHSCTALPGHTSLGKTLKYIDVCSDLRVGRIALVFVVLLYVCTKLGQNVSHIELVQNFLPIWLNYRRCS